MEKKYKLFIIVSVILIIAGPILGFAFNKVTLFSQTGVTISEESNTNITKAYSFPFHLEKDQKVTVEFSLHYLNVTAYLKILGKGAYDSAYLAESPSNGLTGDDFVYTRFAFGNNLVGSANSRSIQYDGYWYIEFAGDTSGVSLISIPGDYVLIIYGTNNGGGSWTDVKFDLTIKTEGPGAILELIFILVGVIALLAITFLLTLSYLKKTRRGLL
jgi:hypothetical protein